MHRTLIYFLKVEYRFLGNLSPVAVYQENALKLIFNLEMYAFFIILVYKRTRNRVQNYIFTYVQQQQQQQQSKVK